MTAIHLPDTVVMDVHAAFVGAQRTRNAVLDEARYLREQAQDRERQAANLTIKINTLRNFLELTDAPEV